MRSQPFSFFLTTAIALAPLLGSSQNGDRDGHEMTPPPEHWVIPPAPVLTAEEELATFDLEPGFTAQLVAAEPMIHDPVAIAFDGSGRLWVAEMRGYMPDIDAKLEHETYGRISVLEDTDADGTMDKSTVFLEDYIMPRALALVEADRSLLFADELKLYEVEIKIAEDGSISPGEITVVDPLYAEGGNPEHKSNGLFRAIDNWFYSSKCDKRYRKIDGAWVKEKTEDRGQWGIAQDNYGRLLTNTNSNLVTVEEVAPNVTLGNASYSFRGDVTTRVKDQSLWPSRINPGVNRGYMEGTLDEDGYLTTPTAASGLAYYRGDQFPKEFQNSIFIPEPAGNLVKRLATSEGDDGRRIVKSAYEGDEFLTSTDERSRIVDASDAPDGSLYLIDFYRGIVQHQIYMTSYLRAQVEERGLAEPVNLGRIWRLSHKDGKKNQPVPDFGNQSSVELVASLGHANGWWRDNAQRIIVERGGEKAVAALQALIATDEEELASIHAVWTLEGLGALDDATLTIAGASRYPRVVAEAIRAADSAGTNREALFTLLDSIGNESEGLENPFIRRQVAASLGQYGEKGFGLLADLVEASREDLLTADHAMSGLGGRELAFLQSLEEGHSLRQPLIASIIRQDDGSAVKDLLGTLRSKEEFKALSRAVVAGRRSGDAKSLLVWAASAEATKQGREGIVGGMIAGGKDKKFKAMPVTELKALDTIAGLEGVNERQSAEIAKLFEIGSGKEIVYLETKAHREQYKAGEIHYQAVCMGCHQTHGNGMKFLAPPLVGSEWVLESPDRLIALVLDGVAGPIEVLGKTYTAPEIQPMMPGLRHNPALDDGTMASILTYVRNAWGNGAKPITAEAVARYRANHPARAPWPAAELRKMK